MVKVTIDLKGAKTKLSDKNMDRGRYALANQALADMNQFVPKRENNLRQATSIDVDGSGINYHMPYAKPQFYGFVGKGHHRVYNYTTPGTSRRWDLRAKIRYMKDWQEAFKKGADW